MLNVLLGGPFLVTLVIFPSMIVYFIIHILIVFRIVSPFQIGLFPTSEVVMLLLVIVKDILFGLSLRLGKLHILQVVSILLPLVT